MKNLLGFMAFILPFLFMCCSSKEDEPKIQSQEDCGRYYVKYEVKISTGGFGSHTMYITAMTENGLEKFETAANLWEATFGPFKKGDNLSIGAVVDGAVLNTATNYVRLSVCREKEPFVVKGEKSGKGIGGGSVSYVIDF